MFKVDELLKATGGRLIWGGRDTVVKGISIDSRTIKLGEAFIAIKGINFDGHDFIEETIRRGAKAVIVQSPSRPVAQSLRKILFIEVKDSVCALGDIARFQREKFDVPVIAIAGSNGKTTTKEMVAWVLSKNYKVLKNEGTKNNQIGLPLTLLNLNNRFDIVVLELGSNHVGEIGYLAGICKPNIGIITNIGPAHLEYLHTLKDVFREKFTLIESLEKPYIGVLNADDNLLKSEMTIKCKRPFIFGFGIKNSSDFFASNIKLASQKLEFFVNLKYKFTLKTLGYCNIYNALAAIAMGRIFGITYKDLVCRFSVFELPQGRLQLIKLNNIKFIDDTYNSNPLSLQQALNTLANFTTKGRRIFIMGDMLELGRNKEIFHYRAGREVAKICDAFIAVGELSKLSAEAAKAAKLDSRNIFTCRTSKEASEILFNKLSVKKEDIVLVKGSRLMKMEEVLKER